MKPDTQDIAVFRMLNKLNAAVMKLTTNQKSIFDSASGFTIKINELLLKVNALEKQLAAIKKSIEVIH